MIRRQLMAMSAFLLVALVLGCTSQTETESTVRPQPDGIVSIEIDPGDGNVITEDVENVSDGSTLETVMQRVGTAQIAFRGSGTTAFIESIDGKGTTSGMGWTFKIDGEFVNQGIGQTELHPPTTVTWKYGTFE
ncbi:DUF4430 domain-containing protein [Stieleria sp. JC731]|uniref:DUF4430 domain-containing protein n=1 Tax=Pirellulaceae TaxID=2691357 RepID=UPI001E2E4B5A|nr:DUF4430 domain-containing protein [Stieleria sp. JC731]MCC9603244.1 DUF4430 domain-containing protein [Stieleria sp. JC731]